MQNYTNFAAGYPLIKPQKIRFPITNYAVNLHREIDNTPRLRKMAIQLAN